MLTRFPLPELSNCLPNMFGGGKLACSKVHHRAGCTIGRKCEEMWAMIWWLSISQLAGGCLTLFPGSLSPSHGVSQEQSRTYPTCVSACCLEKVIGITVTILFGCINTPLCPPKCYFLPCFAVYLCLHCSAGQGCRREWWLLWAAVTFWLLPFSSQREINILYRELHSDSPFSNKILAFPWGRVWGSGHYQRNYSAPTCPPPTSNSSCHLCLRSRTFSRQLH